MNGVNNNEHWEHKANWRRYTALQSFRRSISISINVIFFTLWTQNLHLPKRSERIFFIENANETRYFEIEFDCLLLTWADRSTSNSIYFAYFKEQNK